MNNFSNPQNIMLLIGFIVYVGLTFVQFQRIVISSQLGLPLSPVRNLWFMARIVLLIPLWWTANLFSH